MDLKSWPLTFGTFAAMLAVVLAQGPSVPGDGAAQEAEKVVAAATDQQGPAPPPPATATKCERWCEPLRLIQEFLAVPSGERSLDRIAGAATDLDYSLDVLIALIPDPLDSGMAYRSDEALEAIQRGFADSHYLYDRQWFPWEGEKATETRQYRTEPGALLFRRSSGPRGKVLTLVLLVGETPKSGVHKAALREALDLAGEMQRAAGDSGPLRILGPSFSGTAESLRITLRLWIDAQGLLTGPAAPEAGARIRIVTGSATSPGLEGRFVREFGDVVHLERTIEPDDELTTKTFGFLTNEMGWDLRDVALLSELDTSYGQLFFQRFKLSGKGERGGPFLVQFPSHLAQVRTAREKKRLREAQAEQKDQKKQVVEPSRKALELNLAEEDGEPSDFIPQLSSLSAAGDDMAFANQLHAVCREGVRYVGILATDLQDRLFLAEQVRDLCPDVLLFTFDNHLLEAHPQLTRTMEGSLVLTSFPLYVQAEEKDGVRAYRQSTSELQEGLFQAARRLLTEPGEQKPQEIHSWVAAVGQGNLWPIARLDERQDAPHFTIAGTESVAFKWITASGVIALLAFLLWRSARPIQLLHGEVWMPPGHIPGMRFFPLVGMAALALACGVLLVFYALPLSRSAEFREGFLSGRGIAWGLNLLVLTLVYGALTVACAGLLQPESSRAHGRGKAFAWLAGAVLLLLVLRWALLSLWVLPKGEEFFYARAGDFASGLSPLVSLACLLAAVYAWALLGVRRRRLSLLQGVTWPLSPAAADEPLASCGRLAGEVDGVLWRWFPGPWFWGGLGIALLLPLRRLWGIQPVTEPAAYGWVFLALVGAGFTLGAIAFYRFALLWWRLERLLELLCHTWLLGVFVKNSGFFDWKPLRSFGWRMPRHKMSLLSAEALQTLTRRGVLGADGAALAPAEALDRGLAAVIQADQDRNLAAEIRARQELQKWFMKSAHALEQARPQVPAAPKEVAEEIDKFLALRVVGWIRYVFGHLRFSLISAMTCGLFVLVGVSAYAFQPKRYLSLGIWVFLLAASVLTLRIFTRMDRNTVLSAIGGSDPGKVSFDRTFFSNLFTYAGIPVLGVVLTQFPAVGGLLGDWLQPLLRLITAR